MKLKYFKPKMKVFSDVQKRLEQKGIQCPTCSIPMQVGYSADCSYGAVFPVRWFAGIASISSLLGLKIMGKDYHYVVHFRCPKCCLLQEYAFDPDEL